ncbi:TPA: hypothetical protein ACGO3D_000515 [Streptococcus suis]
MMDLKNLNNAQVDELLKRLKYPKNTISYQKIYTTISSLFGKIDIEEAILDDDDLQYILRIYRGKYNAERFSIHLRFKETNDHLARIDIHPTGRHENPDGAIVTSSHIHIYSNAFPRRDVVAIPLDEFNFPNVRTIIEVYEGFVRLTNIRKTR